MDDLISEFITETSESISLLDLEIVRLEQNPNDPELIGSIFRLMHTIKGTCGFLGLPRLETVAHAAEDVLGKIRDGSLVVTPKAVTLIFNSLDRIKELVDYLASNGQEPEGNDAELIASLRTFLEVGDVEEVTTPEPEVAETSDGEAVVASDSDELQAIFDATPGPDDIEPAGARDSDDLQAIFDATPGPDDMVVNAIPQVSETKEESEVKKAPPVEVTKEAKEVAIKKGLEAEPKDAGGAANQSIRVNLDVLESLMQMVGELVLTRNQLMQIARSRGNNENTTEFAVPLQRLSAITTELQEGVMKTRMQPVGNAWSKFPRLVRDLSMELGKKIELVMEGAETELDRQIIEMIKDPLTHMVRNSVDHGLEMPDVRKAAGKQETGTVKLSAYHEGGHIIIEIADDGKGLSMERIRNKAIENGIATEEEMESLTEQQIIQFIFKPGFSTAEKVTSVSGRGVGMDVVRTNIEKIGGSIEVLTDLGRGSKFLIKIPLTLAIVSVLIVEAAGERFAMPQIAVNELVRTGKNSEYKIEKVSSTMVLRLRNRLYPLIILKDVLGLGNNEEANYEESFVVVCKIGSQEFGIVVDRVFDTEEIVVKPVSEILRHIQIYSGCTILGDGSVIMILDPNGIAKSVGDLQINQENITKEQKIKSMLSAKMVNFLTFSTDDETPKAVPLELVSRIEEVDCANFEYSSNTLLMQYRDELMRIISINADNEIPREGVVNLIVFTFENRSIGLVAKEILDVVEHRLDVKINSSDPRYIGSQVLNGKTTDILDSGYILSEAFGRPEDIMQEDDEEILADANGVRVLLIDDSSFFRNMTAPFLNSHGFVVSTAENGEDALRILESGNQVFDIIVSDIEMPIFNGFELAQMLRNNPKFAKIPLIAYTTRLTKESVDRGMAAGFDEYIAKTDRNGLLNTLKKIKITSEQE